MTEPGDTLAPITATPDPRTAQTPAHLATMLTALKERSGRSYAEMAVYADSEGHHCSMRALMRVASGPLPERDALLAYLAGVGTDRDERHPWIRAHTRLEDSEHAQADRRPADPRKPVPTTNAALRVRNVAV